MHLLLKNLLFTILAPGTVAGFLPWRLTRDRDMASAPLSLVALILFAVGGSIYLWCLWDFATFGRGTPAPIDAPKRLVVHGLYRYTRNPMYVGMLTIILGWAVLYSSGPTLIYWLVVGTVFHLFVRLYEEPHLKQIFGEQYVSYLAEVPRWLPRITTSTKA